MLSQKVGRRVAYHLSKRDCCSQKEGYLFFFRCVLCFFFKSWTFQWCCALVGADVGCVSNPREKRSFWHAVWHAESKNPPGSLLILSDGLALVPALYQGRSNIRTVLSIMRRIFASGCKAGFVLSLSWIPSELNSSDEGTRFFDRDYDPNKSLVRALTQRLTRSSPARPR